MKILLIFIVIFHLSSAQLPLVNGTCPDYSACRGDFNYTFEAIKGFYYMYAVTPMAWQPKQACGYMNFINQTGDTIHIEISPGNGYGQSIFRTMTLLEGGRTIMNSQAYNTLVPLNYETIAMTSEYVISVACLECGLYSEEGAGIYVQVVSRLATLNCQSSDTLRAKLEQCGFPVDQLYFPDNKNCVFSC